MQSTPQGPGLELALVQLPGRMRTALRTFRRITGLTAVASLSASLPEPGEPPALSPPIHPRCARRLRSVRAAPCRKQWLIHLSSSRRSPRVITHTCPIGLRCSFMPIRFDGRLVGVAKLVADSGTSQPDFLAATNVLELAVDGTCQDSLVSILSGEAGVLRQRVVELQQIRSKEVPPVSTPSTEKAEVANVRLVERTLEYLQVHHQDPNLTLPAVARTLACNPKYLTTRFTKIVGEHMHGYLVGLRVARACRLLIDTDLRVKEIACASGFNGPAPLSHAFKRHMGVSPREYRRIFATP